MSYQKEPKDKGKGVAVCCSCPHEKKKPVKGTVNVKLHYGVPEPVTKMWCAECGLYLTTKDQDEYFPADNWTDARPLDKLRNIEDDEDG